MTFFTFPKFFLSSVFVLIVVFVQAQLTPQDINIPMRDGKTLSAHLYLPNTTDTFPTILIQTPYNKDTYKTVGLPLGVRQNIASSNYAFVIVDWRCFYGSTAACVGQADRTKDGYDAVEWIATQSWSDGKIGTWGPSALGNVQFNTAYGQPPHLVCAVPEVCAPQTRYDNYYPGGVLTTGRVKTLNVLYGGAFNTVIDNPYYNNIWEFVESNGFHPDSVKVPMLLVAGWYDHNTNIDIPLLDTLRQVSDPSVRDKHKILIGPWVHGGTGQAFVGSEIQGELTFPDAALKNHDYENAFFDFYLRGIQNGWESDTAVVTYYQMGEEKWGSASTWPPEPTTTKTLFLNSTGTMLDTVQGDSTQLNYVYDPTNPSPSIGGKTLTPGLDQGPYDQRASVENRSDALVFTSDVFADDVVVKGTISAKLFVGSDKPDTDFMARLTEVYPDGRSMLLGEAAIRMRYRNGFRTSDTASMAVGEVYEIDLVFDELANTFNAGHAVRLIITSSNYIQFNRNMNTGQEMYPEGNPDTLVNAQSATNTLYLGALYPSQINMDVVECEAYYKLVEVNVCQGESYQLPNGNTVSSAGLYESVFTGANGCDSIIASNITIYQGTTNADTLEFCEGEAYTLPDGQLVTASGIYVVDLATYYGCDSIVTYNITFNPAYHPTETVTFCNGGFYVMPNGDTTYTVTTFTDSNLTDLGCDSIYTLKVVEAAKIITSDTVFICDGDFYVFANGDTTYTAATVPDTLVSVAGCDSVVTLSVDIFEFPVIQVTQDSIGVYTVLLDAGVDTAMYTVKWYDRWGAELGSGIFEYKDSTQTTETIVVIVSTPCGNKMENVVVVFPQPNGVLSIGQRQPVHVFPNPTNGIIQFENLTHPFDVRIRDIHGKLVGAFHNLDQHSIDISNLNSGVYFIELQDDKGIDFHKVILE